MGLAGVAVELCKLALFFLHVMKDFTFSSGFLDILQPVEMNICFKNCELTETICLSDLPFLFFTVLYSFIC